MELTEPFRSLVYCRHEKGLVGFLGLERNAAVWIAAAWD
jgi:hypothetical protein